MNKILLGIACLVLSGFAFAGPVNINTADAEAIANELVGVGMSKAQAIVNYRNEHGSFDVAEELLKVQGIGPKVLAANRDNIRVSE